MAAINIIEIESDDDLVISDEIEDIAPRKPKKAHLNPRRMKGILLQALPSLTRSIYHRSCQMSRRLAVVISPLRVTRL